MVDVFEKHKQLIEQIEKKRLLEARHLATLIPDFESWLAQDVRVLPEDVKLVDNVLFYVWYKVNEECVDIDTIPKELLKFYITTGPFLPEAV